YGALLPTWKQFEYVHEWCSIQILGRDGDCTTLLGRRGRPCSRKRERSSRFPMGLQSHANLVQFEVRPGRVQFHAPFLEKRIREDGSLERLELKFSRVNRCLC